MANFLTLLRLLLAAPVALAFADAQFMSPALLATLLAVAMASDYFDGKLARAAGTASARGQLLDHGTDFLFVTSSLVSLVIAGLIHPLLPILVVVAFSQYVLDSYFLFKEKRLRMSFLGRWNGIVYFAPLVVVSLSRLQTLSHFTEELHALSLVLGYALIVSTLASIIDRAISPYRSAN
jgi:phosphatidylglycerophosphate synthase